MRGADCRHRTDFMTGSSCNQRFPNVLSFIVRASAADGRLVCIGARGKSTLREFVRMYKSSRAQCALQQGCQ